VSILWPWLRAVVVLLATVCAGATTSADAAAYGYDGPVDTHAATHEGVHSGTASPSVPASSAEEVVDPPRASEEGTSTTPVSTFVAPQTAPGIRGLAGAGDDVAQGGVYALRDPITGQVVRTGRTNDLTRRAGEHLRDPALADFDFEIVARTDIYAQQRGLEQLAHDAYAPALNRIRPISPTNPNRTTYLDAAEDFLSIYGGG
jgi:hypothetical protein